MSNPISVSAQDLVSRIINAAIGIDEHHIFVVYDEKALTEAIKVGIKTPFAGIIYGGLAGQPGADPTRQGLVSELQFAILYGFAAPTIGNVDSQDTAWEAMTTVRKAIRGQRSPSMHFWRWVRETYLGTRNDAVYYAQHWATVTIAS